MICYKKKNQFILSLIVIISVAFYYYRLDSKCVFFYLILFTPTLIILPILWNVTLYDEFVTRFKIKITYNFFQCIMTFVLLLLAILLFYLLITGYIPTGYKAGRC